MTDSVKNCPCCGTKCKIDERRYANVDNVYAYQIECPSCGLRMTNEVVCWTVKQGKTSEECRHEHTQEVRAECIASWNRRS